MYNSRSFDLILEQHLASIARVSSQIALDLNQGSTVYTLARGTSAVMAEQDLLLEEISSRYSLSTASGSNLDEIGNSIYVYRKESTYAVGYVSALDTSTSLSPTIISPGTILVEPSNRLEVVTTNTNELRLSSMVEVAIPVALRQQGDIGNLTAGTRLYSPKFPAVTFNVGVFNGSEYTGDLYGGQSTEDDLSYRQRIGNYLASAGTSTTANIRQVLLNYPLIQQAYVITRNPGLLEIWIDSVERYTASQKQEILNYISEYLPAGVIPYISQASRKPINFEIRVQPFKSTNISLDRLTQEISNSINLLISSLTIGSTFNVETVKFLIQPLVQKVEIIRPITNVVANVNEILVPGTINITYPVS